MSTPITRREFVTTSTSTAAAALTLGAAPAFARRRPCAPAP